MLGAVQTAAVIRTTMDVAVKLMRFSRMPAHCLSAPPLPLRCSYVQRWSTMTEHATEHSRFTDSALVSGTKLRRAHWLRAHATWRSGQLSSWRSGATPPILRCLRLSARVYAAGCGRVTFDAWYVPTISLTYRMPHAGGPRAVATLRYTPRAANHSGDAKVRAFTGTSASPIQFRHSPRYRRAHLRPAIPPPAQLRLPLCAPLPRLQHTLPPR